MDKEWVSIQKDDIKMLTYGQLTNFVHGTDIICKKRKCAECEYAIAAGDCIRRYGLIEIEKRQQTRGKVYSCSMKKVINGHFISGDSAYGNIGSIECTCCKKNTKNYIIIGLDKSTDKSIYICSGCYDKFKNELLHTERMKLKIVKTIDWGEENDNA